MDLNDFESYLDEKILERGLDYYESGNIESLEHYGDEWIADVFGSDDYIVTVALLDNGEILDSSCNCPYDWGMYCKHQAAVYYALRSKLQSGKLSAEKASKKITLDEILNSLDKKVLLSIILEFAEKDVSIKKELFMRYSGKDDTVEYARGLIKSAIEAVKHRGHIEYRDTGRATNGAVTVLKMVDDTIDSNDIYNAVSLCIAVLEEMTDLLNYCDDSNGSVGGIICTAIEKIGEAVDSISDDYNDTEVLFDIILNHSINSIYDGFTEWRIELLSVAAPLCSNSVNRDKMEKYILGQQRTKTGRWNNQYEICELQKLQYDIIERFDGKSSAEAYKQQNLDNSDFRRKRTQI